MEKCIKKFKIRVKRLNISQHSGPPRGLSAEAPGTSAKSSSRRSALKDEHKKTFMNFEKEARVLMLKLKASHTLWHELSGKLNAISSETGAREPPQWRASIQNWRNRVMSKKMEKENLSSIDKAAIQQWKNLC